MIDFGTGFLYGLAKDIYKYLKWQEQDKEVGIKYPEESGLADRLKEEGYQMRWSRSDRVASLSLKGWGVMYEVDKSKKVRYRLVTRDNSVYIGKRNS